MNYGSDGNQGAGNMLSRGTVLQNRYRIIKRLGKGGMGVVYLAGDNRFSNRFCVVKEMMEFHFSDFDRQKAILRFNQEADLLASISHSNIPQVYDRFSEGSRHYLVMEYISGLDFKDLLKEYMALNNNPIPEGKGLIYLMQLCSTLSYLHSHNPIILHRDIKPSNILLTFDGRAKLIDFGIARTIQTNTQGTSVGTQGYAAPEQYRGTADSRADIYSLGATMHHLLTGRDPQKETPFDFPPASSLNKSISPGISDVLVWMLQIDVNKRAQHIQDVSGKIKEMYPDIEQQLINYPSADDSIMSIVARKIGIKESENEPKAFCSQCGFEIRFNSRFCPQCGKLVGTSSRY